MTEYPILVERLDKHMALRIVCETCGTEQDIEGDDINNEGLFACPKDCGGYATFKYAPADHRCPGCGKLGFFEKPLAPRCSRLCQLQADYAAVLAERAPGAAA